MAKSSSSAAARRVEAVQGVQPGMYGRTQVANYEGIDAVNFSTLKYLAKSPRHYAHVLKHGTPQTTNKLRGTAGHVAILEPVRFTRDFAVFDGERRAGKAWEAFKAENDGKNLIKADEFETAMRLRDVVRSDPAAGPLLNGGEAEVTLVWDQPHFPGIRSKGRLDYVRTSDDVIVDVKGTADASASTFGREVSRLQYHVQAAYYSDGYLALTGRVPRYYLIAVEYKEPHDVVVYGPLDDGVLGPGRDQYHDLLTKLVDCRSKNVWPGYSAGAPMSLAMPKWAAARDDDDLTELLDMEGLDE